MSPLEVTSNQASSTRASAKSPSHSSTPSSRSSFSLQIYIIHPPRKELYPASTVSPSDSSSAHSISLDVGSVPCPCVLAAADSQQISVLAHDQGRVVSCLASSNSRLDSFSVTMGY